MFNALDLMDNTEFLEKLKFGIGDGNLNYYLYNWKCMEMKPPQVSLFSCLPLEIYFVRASIYRSFFQLSRIYAQTCNSFLSMTNDFSIDKSIKKTS